MAKKELNIEIGETLYDAIAHVAGVSQAKKLSLKVNINANGTSIPNKIEIDLSEELKGYVHKMFHLIKDHLESKDKPTKEINELKEN